MTRQHISEVAAGIISASLVEREQIAGEILGKFPLHNVDQQDTLALSMILAELEDAVYKQGFRDGQQCLITLQQEMVDEGETGR